MNAKQFLHKTCKESTIHGLPYLVNPRLHLLEKVFWCVMVIATGFFSIQICWNQWRRFRDNPIVYAMQLTRGKNDFPYPGYTICADFSQEDHVEETIEDYWGYKPDSTEYKYYRGFLAALNDMRYDTMDVLRPYENDTNLNKVNLKGLLLSIRRSVFLNETPSEGEFNPNSVYNLESLKQEYAPALTEVGLCRTISQLSEYTNPFGEIKHLPVSDVLKCGFLDECNTKIFPLVSDSHTLFIYLHNVYDIVAPNDRSTTLREVTPDGSLTVELILSWTSAAEEVRNLPIAYRKCRYPDENNLKYFQIYRPGLCRVECRIDAALELCKCKPFYYAVAQNAPVCDIKGMLCLVDKNWTQTTCNCMRLCEELTYISTQSTEQKYNVVQFERAIIVKLYLPRMALKRRVVFSTEQLIVSFGGAIGLFMGASFVTIIEMVLLVVEYFSVNTIHCLNRRGLLDRIRYRRRNTYAVRAIHTRNRIRDHMNE